MKIIKTAFCLISLSAIGYSSYSIYKKILKEKEKCKIKKALSSLDDDELRELISDIIKN